MPNEQRAVVIWSILLLAARMQRVLTYGEIEGFTGFMAVGQGEILFLIYLYCKSKGYPELNSLAVSQETGFPGGNYPGSPKTATDFLIERARVFAYGWSAKDKPSAEDFRAAQSDAA